MDIQELKKHTNVHGRKFLDTYFKDCIFWGATDKGSRKGEFFVIYQRDKYTGVIVLPVYSSTNNGCCSFGDINYYSLYIQSLQPINKGKNHPFLYDVKTEKNVNRWICETFNISRQTFSII